MGWAGGGGLNVFGFIGRRARKTTKRRCDLEFFGVECKKGFLLLTVGGDG